MAATLPPAQVCQTIDCQICCVIDRLVPRDLSDPRDVAVKEERSRMLLDLVMLGAGLAPGGVQWLVETLKVHSLKWHSPSQLEGLFVMLGTGLAPRGVQWLVEILDKVGRLAQGKGHLIQARPRRNISSAFVANRVNASGAQVLRGGGVPPREMMGIL